MFVVLWGALLIAAALVAPGAARANVPLPDPGFDAETRAAALKELGAPELARRMAAVIRLGIVGRPEDLERIAAILGPDPKGASEQEQGAAPVPGRQGKQQHELRIAAARALAGAGHAATIAHFTERAAAGRAADRLEALVILREAPTLTEAARRAAGRSLADSDAAVRLAALEVLTAHPHRDSVSMVAGVLTDGNHEVRLAALRLLGLIGDGRALLPLLDRVDVAERGERVAVIDAIGAVGSAPPVDAGPALLRQLGDTSEDVRRAAIDALGRLRYGPAVPRLRPIAAHPGRELLARRAVLALGAVGDAPAVAALIELLREADPMVEVGAALQRAGNSAVAPIAAVLTDGFTSSARLAAETLASIGDRAATPVLTAALRTRATVAIPAARALGVLRDPSAVPALVAALNDSRYAAAPGVREACLRALTATVDARSADARVVRAVEAGARDADRDVRAAALELAAVARAGLSPQTLATALRDPDPAVRGAAVHAAGALPELASLSMLVELIARPPEGLATEAAERIAREAADILESTITPGDRTLVTQAMAGPPVWRQALLARALETLKPRPAPWVRVRLRATDGAPVAQRGVSLVGAGSARRAQTDQHGEALFTALPPAGRYRVSVDGAAQAARTEATLSGKSPAMTPELPRDREAKVPAHP